MIPYRYSNRRPTQTCEREAVARVYGDSLAFLTLISLLLVEVLLDADPSREFPLGEHKRRERQLILIRSKTRERHTHTHIERGGLSFLPHAVTTGKSLIFVTSIRGLYPVPTI